MKAVPDISPKVVRPKVDALLKILILEDMPADTELVVRELMEADLHYELAICRTDEEFDSQTKSFCPTIILTPYSLSYTNAVKAFKRAREEGCNAPFILLAQDLSEDIAIELLKTGIEDYVLRSSLKRLPIAIKKALLKDRTQRELQLSKDLVKASKASLINMVKNMPMAVAMFDANMQYIVVSEQWLKDEGFTEKELIGKRHYEVNPDLPEHWRKVHQDCLNGSTKAVEKEKITRSNGAEAYIRWKINPWYSPDGRIGGIVLFIEDITAKVATEEEVRSKEQSLRMAQKVGNIGSFEIDVDTRMLTWSDQLYQIIGIDFQDVTYESVIQLVHPDDRERFDSETDSRAATGQPEKVDYRIITPNGEIKFIHSRAKLVKATDGKGPKLVGIVQDMTAQRLMAEEADQNADRLQLAINASNLGVWEWNGVTQRAYYDDQCKSIVGRPGFNSDNLEDLISIVHPEDLSEIQNCFATSVTESGKLNVDFRVFDEHGELRYINVKADFRHSNAPENGRVYGVLRDLTNRKRAEEQIIQNEQIFRQLAENITEVFYLTDIESNRVLFISDTYEELYGASVEELYEDSITWSKRIHPEERERIVEEYAKSAQDGTYDVDYRIVLDNGEIRWVHDRAFPIMNTEGKVVRIAGIAEDITQRVSNEQQIRMLSQVASETVNGVLIQDKEGKIEWMNNAFYEITGHQGENVIGKEPWSFLSGPETDETLIKLTYESVKRKKAFQSENQIYRPDGTRVWISVNFTPILDASGEVSRIVSIVMDTTHVKEQEFKQEHDLKELEEKVKERTQLLETANLKLLDEMKTRQEVSSQLVANNTDLLDSLTYAKRIQKAILPNKTALLKRFDKAFIFAKPKNVVSGDFHWFHDNGTHTMIAAVDCTGHSVPGALMSMVGFMLLDQAAAMNHGNDPGLIITKLDALVRKNLDQDSAEGSVKDGMDMGLCIIENTTLKMQYAGALNILFKVNAANVETFNGTRASVGGPLHKGEIRTFDTQSAQLQRGDKLYLTTDGYFDQFGGPAGKKYMKRRFLQLIQRLQSFDFDDHKTKLEDEFSEWQGDLPQVDDMMVIGLKV